MISLTSVKPERHLAMLSSSLNVGIITLYLNILIITPLNSA